MVGDRDAGRKVNRVVASQPVLLGESTRDTGEVLGDLDEVDLPMGRSTSRPTVLIQCPDLDDPRSPGARPAQRYRPDQRPYAGEAGCLPYEGSAGELVQWLLAKGAKSANELR